MKGHPGETYDKTIGLLGILFSDQLLYLAKTNKTHPHHFQSSHSFVDAVHWRRHSVRSMSCATATVNNSKLSGFFRRWWSASIEEHFNFFHQKRATRYCTPFFAGVDNVRFKWDGLRLLLFSNIFNLKQWGFWPEATWASWLSGSGSIEAWLKRSFREICGAWRLVRPGLRVTRGLCVLHRVLWQFQSIDLHLQVDTIR